MYTRNRDHGCKASEFYLRISHGAAPLDFHGNYVTPIQIIRDKIDRFVKHNPDAERWVSDCHIDSDLVEKLREEGFAIDNGYNEKRECRQVIRWNRPESEKQFKKEHYCHAQDLWHTNQEETTLELRKQSQEHWIQRLRKDLEVQIRKDLESKFGMQLMWYNQFKDEVTRKIEKKLRREMQASGSGSGSASMDVETKEEEFLEKLDAMAAVEASKPENVKKLEEEAKAEEAKRKRDLKARFDRNRDKSRSLNVGPPITTLIEAEVKKRHADIHECTQQVRDSILKWELEERMRMIGLAQEAICAAKSGDFTRAEFEREFGTEKPWAQCVHHVPCKWKRNEDEDSD
jgi:hypothetical protein